MFRRARERKALPCHLISQKLKRGTAMPASIVSDVGCEILDDLVLAQRIVRHNQAAFEILMRRYNAKLFRVARAILKSDADAEDALQEAYLAAYRGLDRFEGSAQLSTWLTRIVINQALGRLRSRKREDIVVQLAGDLSRPHHLQEQMVERRSTESPEQAALRAQLRGLLEQKIDALPLIFRTVYMMREVEDMSVEETAECLSIPAATVRSRLHRARAQLRESLSLEMDSTLADVFPFGGARCDRIVAGVLGRLEGVPAGPAERERSHSS
jgi:RNA polymerase sigma-70 factor (ECF subfamily)